MSDAIVRIGFNGADLQSGLARSAAHVKRFASETKEMFSSIGEKLEPALAALGLGAGLHEIKELFEGFARVGDLAKQLDVSAESVQKIGAMAKLSGSDVEGVAKALNTVNKELAGGKGVDVFKKLGINLRDYFAADGEHQVIMLAEAFQRAEKSGNGLKEAYDLIGKSAADMLPLLRTNVEALKEAAEVPVVSDADIARIQKANEELDKFTMAAKAGAVNTMMATYDVAADIGVAIKEWIDGMDDTGTSAKSFLAILNDIRDAGSGAGLGDIAGKMKPEDPAQKKADAAVQNARTAELQSEADLRLKLRQEQERTAAAAMTDKQRLDATVKKQAELQSMLDQDDGLSGKDRLNIEIAIEDCKQEQVRLTKSLTEEADRTKKKLDQQRDASLASIKDLQAEMEILELRAKGQNKKADALEKENRIKKEAHELAKATGVSEKQALETVRHKHDLEDKIAKRKEGGDHRTHGYSNAQRATNSYLHGSDLDQFYRNNERFPQNRAHIIYPTRTHVMNDSKTTKATGQVNRTMEQHLGTIARATQQTAEALKD